MPGGYGASRIERRFEEIPHMPAFAWIDLDVLVSTLRGARVECRKAYLAGEVERASQLQNQIDALTADRKRVVSHLATP